MFRKSSDEDFIILIPVALTLGLILEKKELLPDIAFTWWTLSFLVLVGLALNKLSKQLHT